MISTTQKLGFDVEALARDYLMRAGLQYVTSNFSCAYGEIDLIMRDVEAMIFVEVRYRQDDDYGGALASVTKSKQHKIIRAAKMYLIENNLWDKVNCRFDVVVLQRGNDGSSREEFAWVKDAFWAGWR